MLILFPIQSEKYTARFPLVTVILIALNIIIAVYTTVMTDKQEKVLEGLQEEMSGIEIRYIKPGAIVRLLSEKGGREEYNKIILSGKMIPKQSEDFQKWLALYEKYQATIDESVFVRWGFIPKKKDPVRILTSMFIHAGFLHLFFNMLFLWTVGCNMEHALNAFVFLLLYLASGTAAALFHLLAFPESIVPCVGASGAVAGIMGAFMIRFFRSRIKLFVLIWFIFRPYINTFHVRAYILLPFWFLQQMLSTMKSSDMGIAHWAHVGGFIFGAVLISLFKVQGLQNTIEAYDNRPEDAPENPSQHPEATTIPGEAPDKNISQILPDPKIFSLNSRINKNPSDMEARLELARIYFSQNHETHCMQLYNSAVKFLTDKGETDALTGLIAELREKSLLKKLPEENVASLMNFFDKQERFREAAFLYSHYMKNFPAGGKYPSALDRLIWILKEKLNDIETAEHLSAWKKKSRGPQS
ncbi:MAG: rhomboid family intramembrane serine protease [Candidatus Aureabacteria bacterium]|nr:rhomboid family intramembrane serine protease [Candidatus Auribacterota bacterium]